jgi:hypothetical protein
VERKYRALRTIATVFKILGWIILVLGLLTACASSASLALGGAGVLLAPGAGRGTDAGLVWSLIMGVISFIGIAITVGLYALILIAAAEGIQVFLDIEQNTREMARKLGEKRATPPPPPPSP